VSENPATTKHTHTDTTHREGGTAKVAKDLHTHTREDARGHTARQFCPLNTSLKNHLESHSTHEGRKGSRRDTQENNLKSFDTIVP